MIKSKITCFKMPWTLNISKDRENWYSKREEYFSYNSHKTGEKAAEEAFHLTNCPIESLENKYLLKLVQKFHGPSLSVGDIVKVDRYMRQTGDNHIPEYYLCKSIGWEKFEEDIIELNKYLV